MTVRYTPAKRITITIIFTTLALIMFAGLLYAVGLFDDMVNNRTTTLLVNVVVAVMNISIVGFILKKLDNRKLKDLGIKLKKGDVPFILVASAVTAILSLGYIQILVQTSHVNGTFQDDYFTQVGYYAVVFISYIGWLFAASHEEVLTRGYFMKNLSHKKITAMILIASLLFTVIHIPFRGVNVFMLITWFFGGLTYSYVYLKTGSLLVTTMLHAAHNLTNDLAFYNLEGFSLFMLHEKLSLSYKGLYEIILFVVIVSITYLFYRKNGMFTPADNLKALWDKRDETSIKVDGDIQALS